MSSRKKGDWEIIVKTYLFIYWQVLIGSQKCQTKELIESQDKPNSILISHYHVGLDRQMKKMQQSLPLPS